VTKAIVDFRDRWLLITAGIAVLGNAGIVLALYVIAYRYWEVVYIAPPLLTPIPVCILFLCVKKRLLEEAYRFGPIGFIVVLVSIAFWGWAMWLYIINLFPEFF